MKKIGLLPKLILAILIGIGVGMLGMEVPIRLLATFNGIFGNFLKFSIPLIIIGFVAPGIGDLGTGAGKLLGITTAIAYLSTVLAGTFTYFRSEERRVGKECSEPLTSLLSPGCL